MKKTHFFQSRFFSQVNEDVHFAKDTCRKGYLNKCLRCDFQIFTTHSIEPGLCDELKELNSVYVLRNYHNFSCLVVVILH